MERKENSFHYVTNVFDSNILTFVKDTSGVKKKCILVEQKKKV